MVEFNLQTFLSEMRTEQRAEHQELSVKVDKALETLHDHETRIVVVEGTRKSIRWLGATMIVAFVGALLDFVFDHLPRLLK